MRIGLQHESREIEDLILSRGRQVTFSDFGVFDLPHGMSGLIEFCQPKTLIYCDAVVLSDDESWMYVDVGTGVNYAAVCPRFSGFRPEHCSEHSIRECKDYKWYSGTLALDEESQPKVTSIPRKRFAGWGFTQRLEFSSTSGRFSFPFVSRGLREIVSCDPEIDFSATSRFGFHCAIFDPDPRMIEAFRYAKSKSHQDCWVETAEDEGISYWENAWRAIRLSEAGKSKREREIWGAAKRKEARTRLLRKRALGRNRSNPQAFFTMTRAVELIRKAAT